MGWEGLKVPKLRVEGARGWLGPKPANLGECRNFFTTLVTPTRSPVRTSCPAPGTGPPRPSERVRVPPSRCASKRSVAQPSFARSSRSTASASNPAFSSLLTQANNKRVDSNQRTYSLVVRPEVSARGVGQRMQTASRRCPAPAVDASAASELKTARLVAPLASSSVLQARAKEARGRLRRRSKAASRRSRSAGTGAAPSAGRTARHTRPSR